jgi:hypothetical protein
MPTNPGSADGEGRSRPQGDIDIGNQDNDGSLTADGRTWEVRRQRKSARAETDGKAPMTATLANYLTSRWSLTLDGRPYTLKIRHAFGGSWVLLDEHGADVGSVFRQSFKDIQRGGSIDGVFGPAVSNAAGLFVLYLVVTVRRNNMSSNRIRATDG